MIQCNKCQDLKQFQAWQDSENVFITANKQATCRECGHVFEFHYGELPTERQIKEAIFEAADQKIDFIKRLQKDFNFPDDPANYSELDEESFAFRKFASYFNISQFLKYGSPEAVNLAGLPPYVLTLWQPWAQLYAAGLKRLETRPKPIKARGTILIHAAKKFDADQRAICKTEPFKKALASLGFKNPDDLPLGAIIGAVDLTQVKRIVDVSVAGTSKNEIDLGLMMVPPEDPEFSFGNYAPKRFVWFGINHRLLEEPLPYTNGQGYYLRFRSDYSQLKFK